MRVANQVDEDLLHRWTKETIPDTRERVLVCVSRSELVRGPVRRGARGRSAATATSPLFTPPAPKSAGNPVDRRDLET